MTDSDDPIFAAIAAYRREKAACAEFMSSTLDDIPLELSNRVNTAIEELENTVPTKRPLRADSGGGRDEDERGCL